MTRALFTLAELEPPGSFPLTDRGRELAARLAGSESLRQLAPDLWRMVERLAANSRVPTIGLPDPATPACLLLAAVMGIVGSDPWAHTDTNPAVGWPLRMSVADTVEALERVQRAARELAAALAAAPIESFPLDDFRRADPASYETVFAAADRDPAVAGLVKWCAGNDIKKAARELATRAGRMAKQAAGDRARKPNQPTARRKWWTEALADSIATPESCEGMTDARRCELIAALAGAILNEPITGKTVCNSLTRMGYLPNSRVRPS